MTQQTRRWRERCALLVVLGCLGFTPPLLLIANKPILVWGIPILYLWLAVVWIGLIGGTYLLSRRSLTP